jgi:hypothetical protein
MDPTHHEKIVDKLMQYRGKITPLHQVHTRTGICAVWELRKQIDNLLWQIEKFADQVELELIK